MKSFLRKTILGGLFVVLPVTFIAVMLDSAVNSIRSALLPITSELPFESWFPGLLANFVLVLLSFVAGLILQVKPLEHWAQSVRIWLSEHFPFYRLLRGFEDSILDKDIGEPIKSAFVELEEALIPAFVIEELDDGRYTVFVPSSPTFFQGSIYVLTPERVHLVDASAKKIARCVSKWGVGTGQYVSSVKSPR